MPAEKSTPQPTAPAVVINKPSRRIGQRISQAILLVLFFSGGLFVGRYLYPAGEFQYTKQLQFVSVKEGERQLIFPTFWEAWDQLQEKFIGDIDDEQLFYGAVAGMVKAVNDPYTVFAPPADTKQFEETINGSFSGIGVEIGVRNGAVSVISPLDGSPASQAGIEEGDIIAAVNGQAVTPDMTLDDVVQQIRGPRGEEVKITIIREGAAAPEEITVTRGTIDIESVKLSYDEDIAYIEITNFNADTAKRFLNIAQEVAKSETRGIIIDVRNNPGGFLESAVDIASRFLTKGSVVVSEQGKENREYVAKGNPTLKDIPIVVLVNRGSASASEILAGALLDQLHAPIIGVTTFGKGSVQEFMKLSDGSSLRITVAKWFTPSGRSINEGGIEPTIVIEDDRETEADEQLNRAKEELQKIIEPNQPGAA